MRHSRTLFDTVMPASHKIRRKLKLEDLTPLEPGTYFKKADCKMKIFIIRKEFKGPEKALKRPRKGPEKAPKVLNEVT